METCVLNCHDLCNEHVCICKQTTPEQECKCSEPDVPLILPGTCSWAPKAHVPNPIGATGDHATVHAVNMQKA